MKNYLLFVASLSALSVCAGVPAESRVVSTPSPGYSLKASPLPYAPLRVNNGGRSAIRNNSGNYAGAPLKARAASLNVAINGYVAYSDNGTDGAPQTPKGMYRIDANGFTNLDATDFSQDIDASYGGTEAGGSYYCAYYWDSQTEEIGLVPFLQQWNTTDWSLTDANFCEPSLLGWDWTYDPVSQRIYGLFTNGSKGVLGIVDT